jgi:hypothetical protein
MPMRHRFVRQFAITQGRARSIGRDLAIDSQVLVTDTGRSRADGLSAEPAAIARMCERPLSIAEISAHLGVHLGIARVLVSDMAANEFVMVCGSAFDESGPDLATLERLLDDLRTI